MNRWILMLLVLAGLWSLPGCSSTDRIAGPAPAKVTLSTQGLEDLGAAYVYEGWLVIEDEMISVGTFTIDAEGVVDPGKFEVPEDDLWAADRFVITIEPAGDDDPAPSQTRCLAGDFGVAGAISGDARLTAEHADALGDDFSSVFGSYLLETPTTPGLLEDYANGIWFGIPGAPPHWGRLLSLRYLPDGWQYEGWVICGDSTISIGRFRFVSEADSDGPGPAAGPTVGPDYPGQDFIDPPMSLVGCDVMITIEPEPDNSPEPFVMVVLADTDIPNEDYYYIAAMENRTEDTFPLGLVRR